MRRALATWMLVFLAGAAVAHARDHKHKVKGHRSHGMRAFTHPGPSEAEVRAALEALRGGDGRLCTVAADRLGQGFWDSARRRLARRGRTPPPRGWRAPANGGPR